MPRSTRQRTVNRDRALKFQARDSTRPAIKRLGSVNRQSAITRLQHLYSRPGAAALAAGSVRDNVFNVESPGEYDAIFWRDDGGRKVHVRVEDADADGPPTIADLKDHLLADLEDTVALRINPVESQREAIDTVVIEGDAALDFDALAKDLMDGFNSDNPTRQLVIVAAERAATGDSTLAVFYQVQPAYSQVKGDLVAASRGRTTNPNYQAILSNLDALIRLDSAPLPVGDDGSARAQRYAEQIARIKEIQASVEGAESTSRFNRQQRDGALDRLSARLSDRRQALETQLRDRVIAHQADASEGRAKAFAKLLKENKDVRAALLPAPRLLRPVVAQLANTQESHAAIEGLEHHLVRQEPNDLVNGKRRMRTDLLTTKPHEVFFRKKTEILEHVIETTIGASIEPGLVALRNLGRANFWKLLIDGKVHAGNDKHAYDRSRGYMASMMKGLLRIARDVKQPLTTDFVLKLHEDATALVTTERNDSSEHTPLRENSFQEQGLKTGPNSWGVSPNFEPQGLQEIRALLDELDAQVNANWDAVIKDGFKDDLRALFNDGTAPGKMRVGAYFQQLPGGVKNRNGVPIPTFEAGYHAKAFKDGKFAETLRGLMDNVIAKANTEIAAANNDRDRVLGAIVDCCRGLGVIHPFKDANGRVMMFLVLNKLLMDNDLPPTILDDQGDMVGKSKGTLVGLIKNGQALVAPPIAAPQGEGSGSESGSEWASAVS